MQEIAVIQSLQAEIVELQVTAGIQGCSQAWQVKLTHAWIQQLSRDTFIDVLRKISAVFSLRIALQYFLAKDFFTNHVHQDACCYLAICRIFFNQSTGSQNSGVIHLRHWYAVVQVLDSLSNDWSSVNMSTQTFAGRLNHSTQSGHIKPLLNTVVSYLDARLASLIRSLRFLGNFLLSSTLLIALFTIENVSTSNVVLTTTHQSQFNLVLNIFDMESSAIWAAT